MGTELGPLAGLPAVLSRALAGIWLPSCSTKTTRSLFSLTSFLLLPGQQEISCALASPVADLKPSEGRSGEDSFPATPTTWPLSLVMTRGASFLPVPGSHCSLVYYVTNPPTSSLPTPLLPASKIGSQMMSRPMLHPCLAGYWPALLLVLKSTLSMGLPFTPAPVMQSPSALASLTPSYAPRAPSIPPTWNAILPWPSGNIQPPFHGGQCGVEKNAKALDLVQSLLCCVTLGRSVRLSGPSHLLCKRGTARPIS